MSNKNAVLHLIISKVGHSLEEIRSRSLDNIIKKLDHGLIKERDLVESGELLENLLKWFNFPSVSKKDDVLKLILRLCDKTHGACEQLLKLDAVRFFSGLKSNLSDDALEEMVDKIVTKLFMLPNVVTEDVSSRTSHTSNFYPIQVDSDELPIANLNPYAVPEIPESSFEGEEYSGFKLIFLSWASVYETDLNVLWSTNISLESDDMHVVSKSIDFLMDVVLKDFPSEVFLQYSFILKNILSISNRDTQHIYGLPQKAVRCLQSYMKALLIRVNNTKDVAMFSYKQGESVNAISNLNDKNCDITDSFKNSSLAENLRRRGDGQDGDNRNVTSDRMVAELDVNFIDGDRTMQISVPQFCLMVVTNTQQLQQSSVSAVLSAVLELLHLSCEVISLCINSNIWNDSSILASVMRQQLIEAYETLAKSILFHHGKCKLNDSRTRLHRLAFCGLINVWVRILRVSVSVEKFSSLELLYCFEGLAVATMDFCIFKYKPYLHLHLRDYLFAVENSDITTMYSDAVKLMKAFKSAFECLNMVKNEATGSFFEKAKESLDCLYYFRLKDLSEVFIDNFSKEFNSCRNIEFKQGYSIMISLLNYHHSEIRRDFYLKCLNIIKKCLYSCDDKNPSYLSGYKLKMFVNTEVLKQIVTSGFEDDDNGIQKAAKEIVVLLLTNKSQFPDELWKDLNKCILPILPLLLGYSDTCTSLGLAVFNLSDDNVCWSTLEMIKANVQFLFSKDQKLRALTAPRIAWLLAKDEDALYKLPTLTQLNAALLPDVFVGVKSPQLRFENDDTVFQNVSLLLRLFDNSDNELETRQRAGYHLVTALSDENVCNQFKTQHGPQRIIEMLHSMVSIECPLSDSHVNDLLPVTLDILWKSFIRNMEFSKDLSTESVYYTLLRVAVLKHSDEVVISFISSILAFMLFNELLQVSFTRNEWSITILYPIIYNKFYLPFNAVNVCEFESPSSSMTRNLTDNELFDSFMRFTWNDVTEGSLDRFPLTPSEIEILTTDSSIGENSLNEISKAASHKPVMNALKMLQLEILSDYNDVNCKLNLDLFVTVFERYFDRPPKSNADKSLLKSLLQFFTFSLNWCSTVIDKLLEMLYKMILIPNGAFHHLLHIPNDQIQCVGLESNKSYSPITKEMLKFLIALLSKSSYLEAPSYKNDLAKSLPIFATFCLQHLNLTDAPQFYNLALLEATLQWLIHITARPNFSCVVTGETPLNLCRLLTGVLMEVIASFHLSRESSQLSYMGRGVTLAATICLSQIAREMAVVSEDEEWVKFWLYNYESQEDMQSQLGLSWIIPLWTHSDVEIRASSMDIVASFTSTKMGCKIVISHIYQLAGGIWGVALTFLLDHSEACIVRQQAVLVLTNLTAHLLREGSDKSSNDVWHGPVIADPELQIPLVGLPALLLLLQRSNFMLEMTVIILHFYPNLTLSNLQKGNYNSQNLKLNDDLSVINLTSDMVGKSVSASYSAEQESTVNSNNPPKLQSFATCFLVKRVCQFLKNLVVISTREIIMSMKNVRMFEELGMLLEFCRSSIQKIEVDKLQLNVSSADVADLLKDLLDLLATCCQVDQTISSNIINNRLHFIILDLLDTEFKGIPGVDQLWTSVYTLLIILMNTDNDERSVVINGVFDKFQFFINNLELVLNNKEYLESKQSGLMCLIQLLSLNQFQGLSQTNTSTKIKNVTDIFDLKDSKFNNREPGYVLSSTLYSLQKQISHYSKTKDELETMLLIFNTYSALLVISLSGKQAALENGLIPSLLEKMNQLFDHIQLLSTDGKNPKTAKFNEMLHSNLICYWNLLKNLMYESTAAKNAANEHNLCSTLLQFWDVTVNEGGQLLSSLLSLVCTYIANCTSAGNSLCVSLVVPRKGINASLLSEVLKFCQQELLWIGKHFNNENLELAFSILATVCFVPVGCNMIIKSKILQSYVNATQLQRPKTRQQERIPPWWLKLFINMTFTKQGREAVYNLPGILENLVAMLLMESGETIGAMRIVRNLCFISAKKNKLLNSNELLKIITNRSLNKAGDQMQLLALSSLWALLANNQKAKSILRSVGFIHRIQDVSKEMTEYSLVSEDHKRITEVLKVILDIFQGGSNIASIEIDSEEMTDVFVQ